MKCYLHPESYYYITLCCIWLNSGVTVGFPEPFPGGTDFERCGSQTCHPQASVPQYCNTVERRCEACNVKKCWNKTCRDWEGCKPQTVTPVSFVPLPGTPGKSNETLEHELKELHHKVKGLEVTVKSLVFIVIVLGVIVAICIALFCELRCRLVVRHFDRPARLVPVKKRGPQSGTNHSTERNDPDETSPMTLLHINDSGIMNSDSDETGSERGDNRAQFSQQQQQRGAVSYRTDGHVDRPRGIPPETCVHVESQPDGKPTSMVV